MMTVLILISSGLTISAFASEKEVTYDDETYEIVRSFFGSSVEVTNLDESIPYANASLTNVDTGEIIEAKIEHASTQKLYDLVNKTTGEPATHYRSDFQILSEHQMSDNASDSGKGMTFYKTIYYTITTKDLFDYLSMNKIDYRFEISDSTYRVTDRSMDIMQIGTDLNNQAKHQRKTTTLGDRGTVLVRDFGWVPVRTDHQLSLIGVKTTAKILRGDSSWNFTLTMNPR